MKILYPWDTEAIIVVGGERNPGGIATHAAARTLTHELPKNCVVRAFAHYGFHNQKPPGLLNRDFPYSERCFCPGFRKKGRMRKPFSCVLAG